MGDVEEKKPNANAPVKTMTVEIVSTGEAAFVESGGEVMGGQLLVAEGRCPGRECGAPMPSADAKAIKLLLDVATNKAHARCLGTPTCPHCGQRTEAWPRAVMLVR